MLEIKWCSEVIENNKEKSFVSQKNDKNRKISLGVQLGNYTDL